MTRCLTQELNFSQTYLLGQLPPRWGISDVDWLSGTECRHCVLHRNFGRLWRDTSTQHTGIRTFAVTTGAAFETPSTHRSSSWARCQPTQCGRWCPPPHSGSAHYCGSQCRDSRTPAPAPDPTAEPRKKCGQKVRKVIAMATKNVESQLVADVAHWDSIRALSESPERLSGQNTSTPSEKMTPQFFIFYCSDREQTSKPAELNIDPMLVF